MHKIHEMMYMYVYVLLEINVDLKLIPSNFMTIDREIASKRSSDTVTAAVTAHESEIQLLLIRFVTHFSVLCSISF